MKTAILNITCRDRKGLVAGVTDFIFRHNGNVIELDQYTDHNAKMFFMRLEWDQRGFRIPQKDLPHVIGEMAIKNGYSRSWELFYSDTKPRMAIFVSKFSHCLYDLLLRHQSGELDCEIPLIMSNHQDLKHIAETFNIDFEYVPVTKQNKSEAEKEQLGLLNDYRIDFVVLARYMQILSDDFVSTYRNKIINVHHSFLPAFKGAKAYHQAHERGVKIIGATSHFVTAELDHGPIIKQSVESISHRDSVADLITKGKDLERIALAEATRLFIEHRLFISKNRTVIL
jgi:formyltetrahydrofolate deformylase